MAGDNNMPTVCQDWVFNMDSNVSVAKDQDWFTEYTPFQSEAMFVGRDPVKVLGVGTVQIPTQSDPGEGAKAFTLSIREVLHCPAAPCNILGGNVVALQGLSVQLFSGPTCKGYIRVTPRPGQKNSSSVGYFDPDHPFYAVKVRKAPKGSELAPSVFNPNGTETHVLAVNWHPDEQERWDGFHPYYRWERKDIRRHKNEKDEKD